MTAVSLPFEFRLFFVRLSFDRRSTVVRPSIFDVYELERVVIVVVMVVVIVVVVMVVVTAVV